MNKRDYLVITFHSTTMALYMEKVCKENQRDGRLIPLPKQIDAGCGMAWASTLKNQADWELFLKTNRVKYDKMEEIEF